jgi:hypothetical protein
LCTKGVRHSLQSRAGILIKMHINDRGYAFSIDLANRGNPSFLARVGKPERVIYSPNSAV